MIGEMEEIYQALSRNDELEFDWREQPYTIQSEFVENKHWLVIWTAYFDKENTCLFREEICPPDSFATKEAIDRALSAKVFDGKSFFEIEQEVELTWICGID